MIAEAWRKISPEEKKVRSLLPEAQLDASQPERRTRPGVLTSKLAMQALEDEYAADRAKYVEDKKAWDEEQAAKSGTPSADE